MTALSVATRRTLLATASDDNTVRVWDYHRQSCQAVHQAAQPVAAVALHPWGTDLIVAHREVAFTYVVAGSELVRGQRLPESAAGTGCGRSRAQARSCFWPINVGPGPVYEMEYDRLCTDASLCDCCRILL